MNLPEPVGEIVDWDSMGSPYIHWNTKPGSITNLYTEAQLREALAQQEAVMRLALEALKRMERYGNTFLYRRDEQNPHEQTCEAIKALKEQLK